MHHTSQHKPTIAVLLLASFFLLSVSCTRTPEQPSTPETTAIEPPAAQPDTAAPESNPAAIPEQPPEPESSEITLFQETVVSNGVQIDFSVSPFSKGAKTPTAVMEGEYALVTFKLSDAATQDSLDALHPSAWLAVDKDQAATCQETVQTYLQGALTFRADINLNGYFILVMNNDATISVLDPTANVAGMTQLFDMILLNRPGEDWVLSQDEQRLFVTLPKADQVAIADMEAFTILKSVKVGANPIRILLSPDEQRIWVGNDASSIDESGVTVIDPATYEVLAQITTGMGHHEIAFSADGSAVFVTNSTAGTLSVIDAGQLTKAQDIAIGPQPAAVAVSSLNGVVYVANQGDGTIAVLDSSTLKQAATLTAAPGISTLSLTPDGRWGFVTNAAESKVYIFDAADNRIAYILPIESGPSQVTFSSTAAYIRLEDAPAMVSVQLADLGQGDSLPVTSLPVGQGAPSAASFTAAAPAIAPTSSDDAMVVVNPADRLTYYYVEGSAAPLGSFQAHGRVPRAALTVSRSLREIEPGAYSARVRIPQSGEYQAAFFLDAPQVTHCFNFSAEPNPAYAQAGEGSPHIEFLTEDRQVTAGESFSFQFRLTDAAANEPINDLTDVQVLATLSTGWNNHFPARPLGDGVYEATMTVPGTGPAYLFFAIPSMQLEYDQLSSVILNATSVEPGN